MVRSIFGRLQTYLDNISVRKKLILSYVLGFAVPLLIVGIATNGILIEQMRRSDENRAVSVLHVLQSQLGEHFQTVNGLAGLLYNDELVQTMLDDWKIKQVNHLIRYRIQLRYYMDNFITAYPFVEEIFFFTTNPAIIQGGAVLLLNDAVRGSEWIRQFMERNKKASAVTHVESTPIESTFKLSLVNNMDSEEDSDIMIETFLRIDLSLSMITKIMRQSTTFGRTYLVDADGNIIAGSTASGDGIRESLFKLSDEVPLAAYEFEYELPIGFPAAFSNLKIVGRFPYQTGNGFTSFFSISIAAVALVSILFASFVQFGIGYSLTRRLQLLTKSIKASTKERFLPVAGSAGADELGSTIRAYNNMTSTIERLLTEVYEDGLMVNRLAVEKRHAELEALFSKINPHFLSNSLNTIRMRSLSRNEDETSGALKSLSRLFDYLTSWKDEMITVGQELEFIRDYLALQRYRFGDAYEYTVRADEDVMDLPLPRMIVQPIVENASIHGIEKRKTRGKISVCFKKSDNHLLIAVHDNGKGMPEEVLAEQRQRLFSRNLSGESIGLQNIYNRLFLMYGEEMRMSIESVENEGTEVILAFPYSPEMKEDERR
jgi:two-component system sensor histidine kinase YesM